MLRIFLLVLSFTTFWTSTLAAFLFTLIALRLEPLMWVLAVLFMLGQYASVKVFKEQWENK